jgi:hypothetical protein
MSDYSAPRPQINTGLLIGSILSVFCCLPLGIVAIVFTVQGRDDQARTWMIAAFIVGVIANIGSWLVFWR